MDIETLFDLIPAYAFGTLNADEAKAIELLLEDSEVTQQLLREYFAVLDALLVLAPSQIPSPELEDKIVKLVENTANPNPIEIDIEQN